MEIKNNKIRMNITINPDIKRNLENLSKVTNYSQSELIEMGLKKLDESFIESNPKFEFSKLTRMTRLTEDEIMQIVLKKLIS